jgi:hypothetical protein
MRTLILILLSSISSYGQITKKDILGKWFIKNYQVDSLVIVDNKNPLNVVRQNMYQLKKIKPDYSPSDSIEYATQVIKNMNSFENYFIEFRKDGTYKNTKIVRGQVTKDTEEGQFELVKSKQTLIQVDSQKRTSENKIEIENDLLRLFINIGDRKTIMTFEKRPGDKNAR